VLKNWLTGFTLLFLCGLIGFTTSYLKPFKSPSASTYFISPSRYLEHFTFGYRELVADLLWLRVIQDMDQCERPLKEGEQCRLSWVYKMVDKVTDLSPKFRIVYATIPVVLAVVLQDGEGAVRLLDKGVSHFPNDWPILYRGGYLYLFEKEDKLKAAEYFLRAQKNGAPSWLASLATKLYSEAGRSEMAARLIQEYQQSGFPPGMIQRMRDHLSKSKR
jgi:hypothetical protein